MCSSGHTMMSAAQRRLPSYVYSPTALHNPNLTRGLIYKTL